MRSGSNLATLLFSLMWSLSFPATMVSLSKEKKEPDRGYVKQFFLIENLRVRGILTFKIANNVTRPQSTLLFLRGDTCLLDRERLGAININSW